ncbi:hypothetical protein MBLNU457_3077t1 [Dothideomycetes sp. NU457]
MSWPTTPGNNGLPAEAIPVQSPSITSASASNPRKRKKSVATPDDDKDQTDSKGRNQPVKRACFRRQEKRQQYAELEKQLQALRAENAELKAGLPRGLQPTRPGPFPVTPSQGGHFPGPNEAAASRSLLDLSQGFEGSIGDSKEPTLNTLAKITLSDQQISELFQIFFTRYHAYLPLLSPDLHSATYFNMSPLLYWTILTVASRRYQGYPSLLAKLKQPLQHLLWDTISSIPQSYHVVKALCLILAWPLPSSSTSLDQSMSICGIMISLAMQFGLHRPQHAQDFSRTKLELREEDIKDRMNVWVVANLMAQNISTGYGMPQMARWNWYTHGIHLDRIASAFRNRCLIERFNDKVTRTLYTMQRDLIVQTDEAHRSLTIDMFARELEEVEALVRAANPSPVDNLHLQMSALHLRLTAFFDSPTAPTYRSDLSALYVAASTLLKTFLALPTETQTSTIDQTPDHNQPPASPFATNYVMQMILAAGFTLLKLLNSFFAAQVDTVTGRTLFLQTVTALRSISVVSNDLPQRLAEVLAQLWQASGAGGQKLFDASGSKPEVDSSLQLKVRCRMSMSLVYDSVWRWKEQFEAVRNLDRMVEHPTQPDNLPPPSMLGGQDSAIPSSLSNMGGSDNDLGLGDWDANFGENAPFDSLGWALDGFLDLPAGNDQTFV